MIEYFKYIMEYVQGFLIGAGVLLVLVALWVWYIFLVDAPRKGTGREGPHYSLLWRLKGLWR